MNLARIQLGIMRIHVALLALIIPDLSRILKLTTLLRWFTPSRPVWLYKGLDEQLIVGLVTGHLRNPWRMRGRRCLRIGLLTFKFLRSAGIPAQLNFGVYLTDRPRELAHCWIVLNGRCLTEPPQDEYVPILIWGASEEAEKEKSDKAPVMLQVSRHHFPHQHPREATTGLSQVG